MSDDAAYWRDVAIRTEAALVELRREHAALFRDVLPHLRDVDLRSRVAYATTSIRRDDAGAGLLAELAGLRKDVETYRSDAQYFYGELYDAYMSETAIESCDALRLAWPGYEAERAAATEGA